MESGEIQVQHLPTTERIANLLTKPLGKQLFEKFRDALQITSAKDQVHSRLLRHSLCLEKEELVERHACFFFKNVDSGNATKFFYQD